MRYPLELRFRPSLTAINAIAAIHLVAAIAFMQLALAVWAHAAVLGVLVLSFAHALRGERSKAERVLVLEDSGELRIIERGVSSPGVLREGCVDFGWSVWLAWRTDGRAGKRGGALMVMRGNLPESHWRSLRIWLRHKQPTAGANDVAPGA